MGSDKHTFIFQRRQVAANRRRSHIEQSAQLRCTDGTLRTQDFPNAKPSFFSKHSLLVPPVARNSLALDFTTPVSLLRYKRIQTAAFLINIATIIAQKS
jgi:hypothetical protein